MLLDRTLSDPLRVLLDPPEVEKAKRGLEHSLRNLAAAGHLERDLLMLL